jgi:hypothetical protein
MIILMSYLDFGFDSTMNVMSCATSQNTIPMAMNPIDSAVSVRTKSTGSVTDRQLPFFASFVLHPLPVIVKVIR